MGQDYLIAYVTLMLRLVLGLIFLSSGILKLTNFKWFASAVDNYRILPTFLITPASLILVIGEVIGGLGILTGTFLQVSSYMILSLLIVFVIAISINLFRKRSIQCGCGGLIGNRKISKNIIIRNLVFCVAVSLIIFFDSKWFSVDFVLGINKVSTGYPPTLSGALLVVASLAVLIIVTYRKVNQLEVLK